MTAVALFLTSTMVSSTVFKMRSDMASESSCVAAISATRSFLVTTFLSGGGGVENSRIVVEVVVLVAEEEGADHDDADTWLPKADEDELEEAAETELEWVVVEVEVEVSSELITEPVVLLVAEPGNHDAQVRRTGSWTA